MTQDEFNEKFIQELNSQQKEAVNSVDGAILLLAVPGSGKTRTLVTRLGYMVCCKNINSSNILTMTYTKAATIEMKERCESMFGEDIVRNLEFSTINALSLKIINYYGANYSKSKPFDLISNDGEIANIIRNIYIRVNKDYPTDGDIKEVRTCITYIKNMMLNKNEIDELNKKMNNIGIIYKDYCEVLKRNKKMDFDDQMRYALSILKQSSPVLEYFQNKYRYICVDESQDTSKIQHEIIKILVKKHNNIFMVGDEDQSIYGFRAAYPQALMNFTRDYKDAKILLMEENYRSSKEIISCANAFVAKNKFRYKKTIKATFGAKAPVQFINAIDRRAQYKYILCKAQKTKEEIAVLYRLNDSALPLIDMLENENIPYNCRNFEETFFSNRIIIDIVDIINFAHNPYDTEIFMRIYYKFACKFTKRSAEYACDMSKKCNTKILEELAKASDIKSNKKKEVIELINNFDKIKKADALEALICLFDGLGYRNFIVDRNLDMRKLFPLILLAERNPTAKDLVNRIFELREIIKIHENNKKTKLTLSTIHSAKGLEYNSVYILDALNEILPSKTVSELKTVEDEKLYEEERRLYYVAITRARNQLQVFNCKNENSLFNKEIELSCAKMLIGEKKVISSLNLDLCGKTFTHEIKGNGIVIAQNDEFLIEYENEEVELLNYTEMLEAVACRILKPIDKREVENQKKQVEASEKLGFNIGTKVEHKKFGKGIVIKVGDLLSVRFYAENKTRDFDLNLCLKNNLLIIINK